MSRPQPARTAQTVSDAAARRAVAASVSPPSPLDKPIQYVRGVGPHRAKLLAKLELRTAEDLLLHLPFRYEVQGPPQPIDSLRLDENATVIGMIERVRRQAGFGRGPVRSMLHATLRDNTGELKAAWFNAPYLHDRIERGQIVRLHGKVGVENDRGLMVNPQIDWINDDDPERWVDARVLPVYNATAGLTSGQIARIIQQAWGEAERFIAEPLPLDLARKHQFPSRAEAVRTLHLPQRIEDTDPARRRLAYEELFLMQLAILLYRRWVYARAKAPPLPVTAQINERIRLRFPFKLTVAQERVIKQICVDLSRPRPMARLLQGDVGSGKTVVALYAALVTVANRHQCAILAPTEVLANQHFAAIERYLAGSRVRRCLLTGRTTKSERAKLLAAVAAGNMDLIVGTQALLEKGVRFARLGLVIVDEQHKFGVGQRATLKGVAADSAADSRRFLEPHYLVMTATPIPRTLSMTVFGDLDVSIINELPPGRQPILTRLITPGNEAATWLAIRRRVAQGDQVYIVYPLVEESDAMDLKAATVEVNRVAGELLPGAKVGLMHGRLNKLEKQAVMRDFAEHRLDVLVSTTVIEVGIDVPNATIMVIQHADRYGLAALHQLRGRVGRGSKPSVCLLMSDVRAGGAMQRLKILCQTGDGFRIAEEDLRLRGPGELLGTRQHGLPEMRVANLLEDAELLRMAHQDAEALIEADPRLQAPEHALLRSELRRRFKEKVAFMQIG